MDRSDELDRRLNVAAGHVNAQHAVLVDCVVELLADRSLWEAWGIGSVERYVAWKLGVTSGRAAQIVQIARRAGDLPVCVDAFRAGRLSIDQMAPIARRAPWWTDAEICAMAQLMTVRQVQFTVSKYPFEELAKPDGSLDNVLRSGRGSSPGEPDDVDDTVEDGGSSRGDSVHSADTAVPAGAGAGCGGRDDRCWFGWGDDGRFRLHAEVDGVVGSILEAALTEARDAVFQGGNPAVDWVDALREVADRSLDAVTGTARRNRFRVHVHIETDGAVTDARGMGIDELIGRYVTCDALLTPVFEVDGIPISVGRSRPVVPERTRREVIRRDHGCAVPGCSQHRFLEVHHIIHWTNDGPTDLWNLIALCPQHHRLHHRGKLGIAGNANVAGDVVFTNEHGEVIAPCGARPEPPGAFPPTPIGRYQHPLGARLESRWLHFNLPPEHRTRTA